MDIMFCEDCKYGKKERVVGSGISELPYLMMIRCPFDSEYYHHLDDECSKKEKITEINQGANI